MGLKYVLNSMKRRKLRTVIVAMALIVGVALVGALLNIVDTQRQFSVQTIGAQTGGYDLGIKKSDLAATTLFEIAPVDQLARAAYDKIIAVHPRIQGNAEARLANAAEGSAVTVIALNPDVDDLVKPAGGGLFGGGGPGPGGPTGAFGFGVSEGTYPPGPGQVYLDAGTAGALGAKVGDEISLSYVKPVAREEGKEASSGNSSAREEAAFIVSGIGVLSGIGQEASSPAVIRLDDAQRWLRAPNQADQVLIIWKNDTSSGNDARAQVTQARGVGEQLRDALQRKLGPDFKVGLPKYTTLEGASNAFIFLQTFITLYGFLSMSIVGLMVNALMNTTVQEQKHDLAVLRVLGAPRTRLFEAVVLEVILLGTLGIAFGLLLGRVINDYAITPILTAALDLPTGVSPQWTLQAALTPTLITALVLALATISPARTAAATKVMVVLNPAAADQPTLEDISKLRERRTNYNLLIVGAVMLAFSSIILFVVPVVFSSGDSNGIAIVIFTTFILLVVGMALIFFFVTTPLERLLVALYNLVNKRAAFFAGRYALRGKGRNALISLMVVMSGVFPTLLATQIALQNANLETDTQFQNGAPLIAERNAFFGGNFRVFSTFIPEQDKLTDKDIDAVKGQPGIGKVIGIADDFRDVEVSDRIELRTARVSVIGLQDDLTQVLYPDLFRWDQGDATALQRLLSDPDAVVISQGMREHLDLNLGDVIRVKGAGFDHERMMRIAGVAARMPGFGGQITRSKNDAQGGGSAIFMNLETYRELKNDPAKGVPDEAQGLLTRLMATVQPGVDEGQVANAMREYLASESGLNIRVASEDIAQSRIQSDQGRIILVVLTVVSMVTAVFGVLAVMYTAVMGRRIEIGMLKAVGAAKGALRGIFIGEAIITTLAAAVAGIIGGTLLGYVFEISQRLQTDQPMLLAFDFNTAGIIVLLVCLAAIFSAALATQPVIRQKAIKILREK